jgi:hypothetical protein
MANLTRNFVAGKMNKGLDERLLPNGQYIDAVNVRLGSTEVTEIGAVELAKGNEQLTTLSFNNTPLSSDAKCIGAFENGENEILYWFVHDPNFPVGATGKCDMIVSFDATNNLLVYHIVSIDDGGGINTTLNFDEKELVLGVNLIENLLFFTDNFNPPRFISTTKNYPNPVLNVDQFSAEDILVIKKPPAFAPAISPLPSSSPNNYMEDRFLSFAYRYRYADNAFSATSPFSPPAFIPGPFNFEFDTFLNGGMLNSANIVRIEYNTGGPLVVGVDLLFKDNSTNVIKVIESFNKEDLGLPDNSTETYTFSNSKVFQVLPDTEIFRTFDNVPLKAKAQTLMGNRLMYGNYFDGNDVVDEFGSPVKLEYFTNSVSELVDNESLTVTLDTGTYNIDPTAQGEQIPSSVLVLDFSTVDLVQGAAFTVDADLSHADFTSDTLTETNDNIAIDFTFLLPASYNDAFTMANSQEFIDAVSAVEANFADSCNGTSLTDQYNCDALNTLNDTANNTAYDKSGSGVDGLGEGFKIIASQATPNIIKIQLNALEYTDTTNPSNVSYEYQSISLATAEFTKIANATSLHSNRGYEIGIIYLDEFSRATTALVSENNNEYFPCGSSVSQNKIQVEIPPAQLAPPWAKYYKFCIKPDKENYDIIYSNLFFEDVTLGSTWFLLEGENSRKIEEGDELIVKADTDGPITRCTRVKVLSKEAKASNFINPPPLDDAGNPIGGFDSEGNELPGIPAGTYMRLRTNQFTTASGDNPFQEDSAKGSAQRDGFLGPYECVTLGLNIGSIDNPDAPTGAYNPADPTTYERIDLDVPAGSTLRVTIDNKRNGASGDKCELIEYLTDVTVTASQDYANVYDFFIAQNIYGAMVSAQSARTDTNDSPPTLIFPNQALQNGPVSGLGCSVATVAIGWTRQGVGSEQGQLIFAVRSSKSCGENKNRRVNLKISMTLIRRNTLVVFETVPQDAAPDLWYESADTFSVFPDGTHEGNVQSQTANQNAIIDTDFFNCYTFGNGVESSKIRDSIVGKPLELGNRTTSTSEKEFELAHRFADITYSGVFNAESNVNKLNEFNLGLLNFKTLEDEYGPISLMDGRATDILVLQEDKISYVLQGKNLLSDSTGGGAVTSVPQVLGTQIARIEDYGNSNNPESFAKWGADKFFTDAKRGAVLQLKGSSAQNEQLQVISETGMRSYFRDLFINNFNTFKLGGYDPYMDEYVLSNTTTQIPVPQVEIPCGITQSFTLGKNLSEEFLYNLGFDIGNVEVDFTVAGLQAGEELEITGIYPSPSGPQVFNQIINADGSYALTFNKTFVNQNLLKVTVEKIGATNESTYDINLTVFCPDAVQMNVVQVAITSDNEAGKFIHDEYRWNDTTFLSALQSEQIEFQSGTGLIVSQFSSVQGAQGGNIAPADGATVKIISNKIPALGDDFNFNINSNSFKFLRTSTTYLNTPTDIANLLAAANDIPNITGGGNQFEGQFTMPTSNDSNLYLIYDYRDPTEAELCYSSSDATDACCGCSSGDTPSNRVATLCRKYTSGSVVITNTSGSPDSVIIPPTIGVTLNTFVTITGVSNDCEYRVGTETPDASTHTVNNIIVSQTSCNQSAGSYAVQADGVDAAIVTVQDSSGTVFTEEIPANEERVYCARVISVDQGNPSIQYTDCGCAALNLRVERCDVYKTNGITSEIVSLVAQNNIPLSAVAIGDFVTLAGGGNAGCIYEVVGTTNAAATEVAQALAFGTCSAACGTYDLFNGQAEDITFSYLDCQGNQNTITVTGGSSNTVCMRADSILQGNIGGGFQNLTTTFLNCGCITPE